MDAKKIREQLNGIVLTNGLNATDYVMGLPERHQELAVQAVLNVVAKRWPLNDMEITSEGREQNRKRSVNAEKQKNRRSKEIWEHPSSQMSGNHFSGDVFRNMNNNCELDVVARLSEGLSPELIGEFERGSRAEQRAVENLIIANAWKNGLYIDPSHIKEYGERKRKRSGESVIYLNETESKVYKIRDPYAKLPLKGHRASDVLKEHEVHNMLFPNVQYRLEGVTEGLDGIRLVLSQKYIEKSFDVVTQEQIDLYLENVLELKREDQYSYGNGILSVTDVGAESDNVLIDDNGELFFIDPIIKFK